MNKMLRKISLLFAAGCFGALIHSLAVWLAGTKGVTTALGVKLAPHWSLGWLFPRLVWGGIWGLVFILPLFSASPIKKGVALSLIPTLVQLFVIYPYYTRLGFMGLALGQWTPVLILVFNAVWGIATALWLRSTDGR